MKISDCHIGLKVRVNKHYPEDAELLKNDLVQIILVRAPNYLEVRLFDDSGKLLEQEWAVNPEDLDLIKEVEDSKWYVKNAIKTDLETYTPVTQRLADRNTARILHAAMGLTTESGEVMDALKKHLIYGKPLDLVNLKEELGDLFWYCAILADTIGVDFEDTMKTNIAKLKARYGEKFTEEAALNRNLDSERKILEGDSK